MVRSLDTNSQIKLLHYNRLGEYYRNGYFIFQGQGRRSCLATYHKQFPAAVKSQMPEGAAIFTLSKKEFHKILEQGFAKQNTDWAINQLERINPKATAKNVDYGKFTGGFGIIFFAIFGLFSNLFSLVNNFAYILQNILKAILFQRSLIADEASPVAKLTSEMPIYSVLVPLYREELKVRSLLSAIERLNYPKDKLDVKFIIEADDRLTQKAILVEDLPDYVHVIKVPPSQPRTKPKALNYAMAYVKGDYVTIYDAEDEPDPDQLLKALYAFDNLPENYACVQARLNFYNANTNLLTKFFSIEYSIWFEYLLRGLSLMDMPVTLGGTSNHFKVRALEKVGYWDAYNVTEDADLGIRLYLSGYKVHLINSTTYEEAPTDVGIWLAQRARWIKGFIQTFYIFTRAKKNYSIFGLMKVFTVYVFVGLSTYSFFSLPWILIVLLFDLHQYVYYFWIINSLFSLSYMYAIAYFVMKKSAKLSALKDWYILSIWPSYFLLHTIASYRAIWEVIKSPFKWNKTPHGKVEDEVG